MSYKIELFHSLLNNFLQDESALITIEGDVLAIRGKKPATYGTLATAANIAGTYLQLQEGDVAILNDPYSGGSTLNEMTFIMAVSEDLLWVRRKALGTSIKAGKTVEEEGLRIPPTPILQGKKINNIILSAIQAHPACPHFFSDWIKTELNFMTKQAHRLINTIESIGFEITGELIEEYLELSKELAQKKISENPYGETRVDVVLDSGELLRMKLEIKSGHIFLDFGGTSAAQLIHLTESAAFGTCYFTLARYFGFIDYANSGTFASLQVTKPSGCWLMAKYPASTYIGMNSGIAALQTALELALSHLHQKKEKALCGHSSIILQMEKGATHSRIELKGGEGAKTNKKGAAAQLADLSIEKLERELPIKIHSVEHRDTSEGSAKFLGGQGLKLKLEALEDIEISWISDLTKNKPRLTKNCSHGDSCEVSLESSGTVKSLENHGHQNVLKGTILTFHSGNGGGFGR